MLLKINQHILLAVKNSLWEITGGTMKANKELMLVDFVALVVDANMVDFLFSMLKGMTNRTTGKRIFSAVWKATNFKAAWQFLNEEQSPDIVICDVDLDRNIKLSGLTLLQDCFQNPNLKHIPFIMLSGETEPELLKAQVSASREWGCSDFLIKPLSQDALEEKIRSILLRVKSPEFALVQKIDLADPEEALTMIKQLENRGAILSPKLLNIKGEKLSASGNEEAAVASYQKAAADAKSAYLAALKNLAASQSKLGQSAAAMGTLSELDALSPLNLERKIELGGLLLEHGQAEEGQAKLSQAVALGSQLGKRNEVVARVQEVVQSKLPAEACNEMALELRKNSRYEEAEKHYKMALSFYPDHPLLLFNLGVLYVHMKKYGEAIAVFKAALKADPTFQKAKKALVFCEQQEANK